MKLFYHFTARDLNEDEVLVYRTHPHFVSFLSRGRSGFFWISVGIVVFFGLTRLFQIDLVGTLEVSLFVLLVSGIPFFMGLWISTMELINWLVDEGIVTVRFTVRNNKIRIIGAGYWRKGKKIYEKENN